MSTPTPAARMEDIVTALGRFPDGATLEQIEAALAPCPARRTVQYWLMLLAEQGRILADRTTTAARYRLPAAPATVTPSAPPTVAPATPPVSAAHPGGDATVTPPVSATRPAGDASVKTPVSAAPRVGDAAATMPVSQSATSPDAPQTPPVAAPAPAADTPATPPVRPITAPAAGAQTPLARPDASAPTPPAQATGPLPSRPAAAPEDPAATARYAELFEASVMQIVVAQLPKVSWVPYLQNTALLQLRLPEQRRAYVAYGKARLERLTPEEAEQFGIDRSQYDYWRALD